MSDKIDAMNDKLTKHVEIIAEFRGMLKAIISILALFNTVVIALSAWALVSIVSLREQSKDHEARIKQVESVTQAYRN